VNEPDNPSAADEPDVVLLHGATEDGEGAKVLRARHGRIEAGEVRPMREGRPLAPGGEVVRLEPRKDTPALYDVHVEHVVPPAQTAPAPPAPPPAPARAGAAEAERPEKPRKATMHNGPPQIATLAYRESWDRTFGRNGKKALN
jgi:hypothetical protein